MSNSRACPGQSSPAEGSFREQRTFPLVETLPSFVSEHSSGQAPLHHMIPISCWENSIKMAPWSVWLAFSNDSSTRETKRGLNVASDLYKFRTVKEESLNEKKIIPETSELIVFFLARHRLMLPSFMIRCQVHSRAKKEKKKKLGPLIKTKKSIICRNAAAAAAPEKHLSNTLPRLSAVHSKTQNLPSGAFLLIMKIS